MRGFTLIELMIVIAIIAIIAAISIPGLLSSQRGANERNSSASLKSIATAEVDFRQNDRDSNGANDFWIDDIQGLYSLEGTPGSPLRLLESPVARADSAPDGSNYPGGTTSAVVGTPAAKSGYWFRILDQFELNGGVVTSYDAQGNGRHFSRFGAVTFPDDYGATGIQVFIVSEANTMWKQDGALLGMATGGGSAGGPVIVFPADPPGSSWGSMDY